VEVSGRQVEGPEDVRKGLEGVREARKRAEEAGRLGKVMVCYSKMEPGFGIHVCGSPVGHSRKGRRDSVVEALAEFYHNLFRVGVAGVLNEVLELVEVIVDRPSTLKVRRGFQHVHSRGFGIEGHEVLSELLFKIDPVDEAEVSGLRFVFKFAGHWAACTSRLHVRHCPDDLGEIIFEGLWAEADVGLA